MSGMYLLATILCLAVGGSMAQVIMEGNYNVTGMCTTVKLNTKLGSIVSCDYYYLCTQDGPVKTSCQQGYSYNFKTESCSPSSTVDCYYGLENPCQDKTSECWVPVVGTCNQWIYCNNSVAKGQGSCGNMVFNATSQRCSYGKCDDIPNFSGPNLVSPCEVVKPGMFFGSQTDCQTYNYCYPDGRLASAQCPTSAWVAPQGACGYNVNGNCDRITQEPVPDTCSNVGDTVASKVTCGSYLFCDGKTYVSKTCPSGQYFDTVQKACIGRQQAVAAAGCNRCQYATTAFVNAADSKYCMDYYYCNKGQQDGNNECPYGYYFNEESQGCANNAAVPTYAANHGACYGAVIQPTTTAAPTTSSSSSSESTTEPTTTTTKDPEDGTK